jgi:hypothetical protein
MPLEAWYALCDHCGKPTQVSDLEKSEGTVKCQHCGGVVAWTKAELQSEQHLRENFPKWPLV